MNITLGDIATIQTGPFGSQLHASDYVENGIPVIMPTNIGDKLNIVVDAIAKINENDLHRLSRYQVYENDIVYSRRGDVERCAFITKSQNNWLCGTGCLRVRFKRGGIVPKFFAYQLSTDEAKGWISGHAVGSTMPNLNSSILAQVPLFKPDVEEQRAIAAVLSNLDDKIDLLQRQNATLEAMAEAMFKQWFVVEAKEEWAERTIGEVLEVKGGSTPRTKNLAYWNGDIPWTSPRDLTGKKDVFLLSTERSISEAGLAQISSGLLPKGTLLLSSRAPIGYLAITDIELAINQGYIAILNNSYISNYYMYLWCKYNMDEIKAAGNGSVFQEISKSVFRQLPFLLPSKNTLSDFNGMIEPYFQKIHSNQIQIQTLEKLRDTLLPKLMSGEVRVSLD